MKQQSAGFSMSQHEKGGSHASNHQRQNRKCLIIAGVIVLVIVVTIAIVVPVVLTQKGSDSSDGPGKDIRCAPLNYPGVNISQLSPTIISIVKTCPKEGDCWRGEQCYECFKLSTWKVGNINNIPVCCPQCELSGLAMSESRCDCRHNG